MKRMILPAAGAALFWAAAALLLERLEDASHAFALIAAGVLAAAWTAALLPLRSAETRRFRLLAVLSGAAVLARLLCLETATSDFTDFLAPWVERLRTGGFSMLGQPIGNYNVPYMTLLALFARLDAPPLYLIKLSSILFDLLLAVTAGLLLREAGGSRERQGLAFLLTLCLPTVFLNGAVWGQCDSMYVSLGLLALWLCLRGHPVLSMAALGLSFSLKLQAIFLLPLFLPLLLAKKLRWRHLPVFFLAYLLAVSPALLAGGNVMDTLLFYLRTASTAGTALTYNAPSMYSLLFFYRVDNQALAANAGIGAAFLACVVLCALLFRARKRLTNRSFLYAALLFCLLLPLLLPHMHDRYFYFCDVLSLVCACLQPWRLGLAAPLCQFASLLGYHAYFFRRFLLPMRYGFLALLMVLLLTAWVFVEEQRCGAVGRTARPTPE